MHPGDKPGLGIEFDEKLAANIPMNLLICQSHVWKMARCGLVRSKIMKSILIEKPNQLAISNVKYPPRQRVKYE